MKNLSIIERFGLISTLGCCSVSNCSNIAKNAGRNTKGEFTQFLGIASISALEILTQLRNTKK